MARGELLMRSLAPNPFAARRPADAPSPNCVPDDVSGEWILVEQGFDETRVSRMTLETAGSRIAGSAQLAGQPGRSLIDGARDGAAVTLRWIARDGKRVLRRFTGQLTDGAMAGDVTWRDLRYGWTARRPIVRPTGEPPRTHDFTPTRYPRLVSADIPPALRVFPGDTIRTTTVDAEGVDGDAVQRVLGANPLTGPFHVEGALPGDTLVVRLDALAPNRAWAMSGTGIIPNALPPDRIANRPLAGGPGARWTLDRERGLAALESPSEALAQLRVPIAPMLGYIGVAPEGGAALTARDAGVHGGNLDYQPIAAGATVYLPVFHDGARLFIGDGHAAQGAGELGGDALETSMAVAFTVDVQAGGGLLGPLVENASDLMAIGVGGSLEQAVQAATATLATTLERRYQLTPADSSILLGLAIAYDIAGLANARVSVAARVPKTILHLLHG
jgi:acetamidase/formamidase